MKTLIIILFTIMTSIICYGQSNNKKPIYSMEKRILVVSEGNYTLTEDSTKQQDRPSISMYKNDVQILEKNNYVNQSIQQDTSTHKNNALETKKKSFSHGRRDYEPEH